MTPFPAPAALTRHRSPALLIAAVLECAAAGGRVRLLRGFADDPLALLEGAAQAAAVLAGAAGHATGAAPRPGALVAVRACTVGRTATRDEQLEIDLTWGMALGTLREAHVTIRDAAAAEVMRGTLAVAEGVEIAGPAGASAGDGYAAAPPATSAEPDHHGSPTVDFAPQRQAVSALESWQAQSPEVISALLRFPVDLPLFAGHFPGHPLVPGVHLLAGTLAAVRRGSGGNWTLGEVMRAKFTSAVRPGDEARITARWRQQPGGLIVDASITVAEVVCMTCRLSLKDPLAPPPCAAARRPG